ncbi:nicotinate-nucleotide--dimethylbenzimidazole phosphoribosyltransferase [Kordiimonas sp.]|uniref:nicotinate-nucleotide--dimethylbenzimidazole phosphoribosyltransferase n=1 Tax=Kordiimonas sp. TaxID=1970157 RepID=UPI003A8FA3CE
MLTGRPFDDLNSIVAQFPAKDDCGERKFLENCQHLGGRDDGFVALGAWLAAWQGKSEPKTKDTHICFIASSYQGAADPAIVKEYIAATAKGRAPVNLMCVDKGIGLRALEMAPEMPHDPAADWPEAECMAAVAFGMEAAAAGGDLLGLATYAPGGDEPAKAVLQACLLSDGKDEYAPLEALRSYGGREIAGAVGALIAARSRRLPVLAEGWACLAAIAVLEQMAKGSADHVVVAAATDDEQLLICDRLGKKPIIGPTIGIGPGCASAAAVSVLAAACLLPSMPTR